MGYAVELSFDVRRPGGASGRQEAIDVCARRHNCSTKYTMYETEGRGKHIKRSESITVVTFDEDTADSLIAFITDVKRARLAYVDCIYRDDNSCDLLYASSKYVKLLDKPTSLQVRRNIREKRETNEEVQAIALAATLRP